MHSRRRSGVAIDNRMIGRDPWEKLHRLQRPPGRPKAASTIKPATLSQRCAGLKTPQTLPSHRHALRQARQHIPRRDPVGLRTFPAQLTTRPSATNLLLGIREDAKRSAEADGIPISPFIFTGVEGRALTDIKRNWASVCKKAGLIEQIPNGEGRAVWRPTVRMHDLRHSFASILVSAGASLPLIGRMLGHTQAQTTARYAHLYDESLREAAEMVCAVMQSGPRGKWE